MKGLKQVIAEAAAADKAVGHFNVANVEMLWAIFRAAKSLDLPDGKAGVPVIIGVSEGERDAIGLRQIVALVKSLREEFAYPIFLNADHTYSVDKVKEALAVGFDAAIFDGAELPLAENIKQTKVAVDFARNLNPEIILEGELGYIGKGSEVHAALPAGVDLNNLTTAADAEQFVKATGVDLLAPAVGNLHGILAHAPEPRLNIERIKEINAAAGVPLVLHGASGNSEEDLKAAIKAGVAVVHVSTELRIAWRDAVKFSFAENPDEVAPYKLMKPATLAVEKVVAQKLRIFNNLV